ncbi:putative inorganic phosphate cotransporter isoform X1 [Cherax quadricarinatus]|nr:putative inorganic phosphate cotransporter isoform X1 [Cherax quadricarinatus]XP_053629857.1 putative inorganic phosphate cotransporter isoform X1 [Cherax quadricarinatus]XP_053629858.1 putative inorganic phosphate cotransporter isoform X1 [Cherax quadricarinatus]
MRNWNFLHLWSWLLSHVRYSRVNLVDDLKHQSPPNLQQKDDENMGHSNSPDLRFGKRHVLIILLFLGFAGVYAMRVNLSVAIVAMVKSHPHSQKQIVRVDDTCPVSVSQKRQAMSSEIKGEFDWDEKTQGMILGSFFYGYLLTNYLGGRLAERLGGRLIFGAGVTLTGLLTVISPMAARHSSTAFVIIRILEGMTEGVTFPAMNVMMSYWIPPQERARSLARIVGGCQIGTVVTLSISGWLTQTEWGWPSVFIIFGLYGLAWGCFWFMYAYDSPDLHPTISTTEKLYIKHGTGDHRKNERLDVPWQSIFTSTPFLVVIAAHVGQNWGFYCILTELPTYLKNIQHFDMKQNGILSAMPYLVMWLFSLVYSTYMDHLLEKGILSTKQIRQLSTVIATYIPMISLLLIPWAGCDGHLVVVLICIAVGTTGASFCGMHCAFQELAPNFSGTLTGISNTMATIPGFLAPAVTGAIINNQQTLNQWKKVFQLVSLVYLILCSLYLIFLSVEVQPWNEGNTEKRKRPLKEIVELKSV